MSDNSYQYPAAEGEPAAAPTWAPPQGAPVSSPPAGPVKPKMGKGKKAGLWGGGILVALIAIGAIGGDPKTAPTAAPVVSSRAATVDPTPTATVDTAAADKAAADKAAADKAAADKAAADKKVADAKAAADKAAADKKVADAKAAAAKAADAKAAAEKAANAMTVSQEQAISQAESYLEYSAFSRKGLIKQLQFEQFSVADATFAVDHIKVNWNEQAAKQAQSYLDYSSFSRGGLIDQLRFEGFTKAQATYGAKAVGL